MKKIVTSSEYTTKIHSQLLSKSFLLCKRLLTKFYQLKERSLSYPPSLRLQSLAFAQSRTFAILFCFMFSYQFVQAQGQLNLRLQTGFPLEEFAEENETIALGIGGNLLFPVNESGVVSLGLDAGYMIYGMQSEDLIDNNGFEYTLNTNNNIFEGFLMARFKPRWESAIIYPYVDGLLGGRYIYTRTTEEENGEELDAFIEQDGFSFAYGGAGGLLISLSEEIKLDFRAVYTQGSRTRYLTENSIYPDPLDPNEYIYDIKKTRTDMLTFQLGITFFVY